MFKLEFSTDNYAFSGGRATSLLAFFVMLLRTSKAVVLEA